MYEVYAASSIDMYSVMYSGQSFSAFDVDFDIDSLLVVRRPYVIHTRVDRYCQDHAGSC